MVVGQNVSIGADDDTGPASLYFLIMRDSRYAVIVESFKEIPKRGVLKLIHGEPSLFDLYNFDIDYRRGQLFRQRSQ